MDDRKGADLPSFALTPEQQAKQSGLWPVYEFRPLPEHCRGTVLRYADGQWLPDDGEFDLAFMVYGAGAPMAYYVDLPFQRNIVWSGLTSHWSASNYDHPRANPWHYMMREGESEWGGDWGRDRHLNTRVGREAMSACCARNSCANGDGPQFKEGDRYIVVGLLRERETKAVVTPPDRLICMYCGDSWHDKARCQDALARETAP